VVAQPGQDAVQYADPGGVPGQALVRADDHHPAAGRCLGVQLIEFPDHLLLVAGRVEAGKSKLAMSLRCTDYGTVANGRP